ncbi:hypothetical protein Tco_1391618 [Tanacetum coccineum]
MESVLENGPWLIRREPLMLNVWSQNTDLKKAEVKKAPVWVKLHHVPIVAYSEVGLSLITTQKGKPIMLDTYTSNMYVSSWGRSTYARALIEVSVEVELVDELVIAIPVGKDKGHTLATITVEYEWRPPRCSTCMIFDHTTEKCPKRPKEVQTEPVANDGFEGETSKSSVPNKNMSSKAANVESTPSTLNKDTILVSNSFTALTEEEEDIWGTKAANSIVNDSDSEDVDDELILEGPSDRSNDNVTKGASTPDVNVVNLKKELFCSFIYAHNRYTHRRCLWSNLEMHKVYIRHRPWCLLGDYNAALTLDDMVTGSSIIDISMREFKECVDNIEVMDVQNTGLKYTWTQKPKGTDGVLKKLDRVMANLEFFDVFPGGHAIFQPYRMSDHSPAVLCLPSAIKAKPKPFKFTNILVSNPKFKEVVKEGWNKAMSGFHMYKLVHKLKHLKKPLRKLLIDKGNLHENVKRLRHELDTVQRDLDRDPLNVILREEETLYIQAFNDAILLEERFIRNRIDVITNSEGVVFENEKVSEAFVSHYEVFLGQSGSVSTICTSDLFVNRLDIGAALDMIRDVNDQEIKDAIFSMGNDKSPGPDGFTAAFFKEAWDIVANNVILAVREFFVNGKLLKELNHTIIALVPKVASPSRVNDFRPTSYCNVLFKCISKIIANRIKESLKTLVSPNQSAFVPGRNISDNILLTQELMHNYHLDRGPPRCAFKVDIQKAYDTVDWSFLKAVLLGFGFHVRLVEWIMECVTTASFSISINGSLHGYFKGKRGLHQGDPLSPYLFTLVMEILTLMISKRVQATNLFTYHRYCSKLELVNLCFADDLFLFAYGDTNSARVIMDALDEFQQVSGLIPSLPKSTAYFCNVLNHVKLSILQILPFEEGRLPVKYLGVPLVSSRLIYHDCKELIEKVQARVDNRKNKLLSTADFFGAMGLYGNGKLKWHGTLFVFLELKAVLVYAGVSKKTTLDVVLSNGHLNWPNEWYNKYPLLNSIANSIITPGNDKLEWHDFDGLVKPFSVHTVWNTIRPRSAMVWLKVKRFAGLPSSNPSIDSIIQDIIPFAKRKTSRSIIAKLVVAATSYFIWKERNNRMFKKSKRSNGQVVDCIINLVRLKLLSCKWKKSKAIFDIVNLWNLGSICLQG